MLELAGMDGGRDRLDEAIQSGAALQKFIEVVKAHGGDPLVIDDPSLLAVAPREAVVVAPGSGYVTRCDALTIGTVATHLGAGRERKKDTIDPGVGITLTAKLGSRVAEGDTLAIVRYSDESKWEAQRDTLGTAWLISDDPTPPQDLIIERIDVSSF
jgi:thymidine phosphorylase